MIYDIVILTDHRYLKDSKDPYKHNVYLEDSLLKQAIQNYNLRVGRKSWDDPKFDWSSTNYVIFRTTWDYFDRFSEFMNWLAMVSQQTKLLNTEALIRWNLDKHYLNDLADKNINITPTMFIEKGDKRSLKMHQSLLGWKNMVLKPCVSGAGRHTYKLTPHTILNYEEVFAKLVKEEAMILQPFQHHIETLGEVSMMVIDGAYTHAVLKKAKAGDFRVQDDFGGTVHDYSPTAEEIEFAENAVKACFEIPIYARVDIFKDNTNNWCLSELELIEPELWFRNEPDAADQLANAIFKKIVK